MPGPVSDSYEGPSDDPPNLPAWAFKPLTNEEGERGAGVHERGQVMTEKELRELDAEVHRVVMGKRAEWVAAVRVTRLDPDSPLGITTNFGGAVFTADREWLVNDWLDPDENREVPHYSEDVSAAWQVVDRVSAMGHGLVLQDWRHLPDAPGAWAALFDLADGHDTGAVVAGTASLAICKAAMAVCKAAGK